MLDLSVTLPRFGGSLGSSPSGESIIGGPCPAEKARFRRSRPGRAVPQLPATLDEIRAAGQSYRHAYPKGVATELVGVRATEQAFRERDGDIATSIWQRTVSSTSLFPASNRPPAPETSASIVAGLHPGLFSGVAPACANRDVYGTGDPAVDPEDDGILTALDVAELNLAETDLVVLSACDTGIGWDAGGEGLLGLQRAFHYSGARSVVASLWQTDSNATRDLFVEFYRNLWERKLGKLESLRQATTLHCYTRNRSPTVIILISGPPGS